MNISKADVDSMCESAALGAADGTYLRLVRLFDEQAAAGKPWAAEARDFVRRLHASEFVGDGVQQVR